jgi:hypothetical protein
MDKIFKLKNNIEETKEIQTEFKNQEEIHNQDEPPIKIETKNLNLTDENLSLDEIESLKKKNDNLDSNQNQNQNPINFLENIIKEKEDFSNKELKLNGNEKISNENLELEESSSNQINEKPRLKPVKKENFISRETFKEDNEEKFDIKKKGKKLRHIKDIEKLKGQRFNENFLVDILSVLHIISFIVLVMYVINTEYDNRLNWKMKKNFKFDSNFKPNDYTDYTFYAYRVIEELINTLIRDGFWSEDGKFEIVSNIRTTKRVNILNDYTNIFMNLPKNYTKDLTSVNTIPINPYEEFAGDSIEEKYEMGKYKYTIEESN